MLVPLGYEISHGIVFSEEPPVAFVTGDGEGHEVD